MTYEERRANVCEQCITRNHCPYERYPYTKERYCEYLNHVMYGWELGQQDTIEEIEKALSMDNPCDTCSTIIGIIERLKKG